MSVSQQEEIDRNVRRSAGLQALKEIRGIVEEDQKQEAAKAHLLRTIMRYGWAVLLLLAGLLARYFGVI